MNRIATSRALASKYDVDLKDVSHLLDYLKPGESVELVLQTYKKITFLVENNPGFIDAKLLTPKTMIEKIDEMYGCSSKCLELNLNRFYNQTALDFTEYQLMLSQSEEALIPGENVISNTDLDTLKGKGVFIGNSMVNDNIEIIDKKSKMPKYNQILN